MTNIVPPTSGDNQFRFVYYTAEDQKVDQASLMAKKEKAPKHRSEPIDNPSKGLAKRVKRCPTIDPLWRCFACHIARDQTPRSRKGPTGKKTLCNACGLRWAKRGNAGIQIAHSTLGLTKSSDVLPISANEIPPKFITPKMKWKYEHKDS